MTMHHSYSTKIGLILESRPMKILILEHFSITRFCVQPQAWTPPQLSNTPHKVFRLNLKEQVWTEATQPLDLWHWDTFFLLPPQRRSKPTVTGGNAGASLVGTNKADGTWGGPGICGNPTETLKHKTVTIQMIVFGTAKDIAPLCSTSLHRLTPP